MVSKKEWHIRDKWVRHTSLERNPKLAHHLPPTRLLSRRSLEEYLQRYRVVYIKPVFGSFGNNIIRVTRRGSLYYVHRESKVEVVSGERLAKVIFKHTRNRRYLIQKGISLLRIKGSPVDYRLLLIKRDNHWNTMGIMGKVATGNRVVTNFNHGGRPIRFRESLRSAGFHPKDMERVKRQMHRIGVQAAATFGRRFRHCRRMGIDFALDENKRVWIIEINTNPFYDLFRFHEDKKLHGRIDRYMKEIRRFQSDR